MAQIILSTGGAQPTPATGKVTLYSKTDKNLYYKDDTGAEFQVSLYPGQYGQRDVSNNAVAINKTAAVDSTLGTNTDYTQVIGIFDAFPEGLNVGITQQTNSLTVAKTGPYEIHLWASLTVGLNNTNVAFKFAVNGVISLVRRPMAHISTAGDPANVSANGFVQLNAGDVVTLWMACTNTTTVTIRDMVFSLKNL